MGACSSLQVGNSSVSHSTKVEFIKKTPFFMYLDDRKCSEFADCFTKVRHERESLRGLRGREEEGGGNNTLYVYY